MNSDISNNHSFNNELTKSNYSNSLNQFNFMNRENNNNTNFNRGNIHKSSETSSLSKNTNITNTNFFQNNRNNKKKVSFTNLSNFFNNKCKSSYNDNDNNLNTNNLDNNQNNNSNTTNININLSNYLDKEESKTKLTLKIFMRYSNNELNKMSLKQFSTLISDLNVKDDVITQNKIESLFFKYAGKNNINFDVFCDLLLELTRLKYKEIFIVDALKAVNLFYMNYMNKLSYLSQTLKSKIASTDNLGKSVSYLNKTKNDKSYNNTNINFSKINTLNNEQNNNIINTNEFEILLLALLGKIRLEKELMKKIISLHFYLLKLLYNNYFQHEVLNYSNQQKEILSKKGFISLLKDFLVCPAVISHREISALFFEFNIQETIASEIINILGLENNNDDFNNNTYLKSKRGVSAGCSSSYDINRQNDSNNNNATNIIHVKNGRSLSNCSSGKENNNSNSKNTSIVLSHRDLAQLNQSNFKFNISNISSRSNNNAPNKSFNFEVKSKINNDSCLLNNTILNKNRHQTISFEKFISIMIFALSLDFLSGKEYSDYQLSKNAYSTITNSSRNNNNTKKQIKVNGKLITLSDTKLNSDNLLLSEFFHNRLASFYSIKSALEGKVTGSNIQKFLYWKDRALSFKQFNILLNGVVSIRNVDDEESSVNKMKNFLNVSSTSFVNTNRNSNNMEDNDIKVMREIEFDRQFKSQFLKLFLFFSNKKCDDYPFFFMNLQELSSFLVKCKVLNLSNNNNNQYLDNKVTTYLNNGETDYMSLYTSNTKNNKDTYQSSVINNNRNVYISNNNLNVVFMRYVLNSNDNSKLSNGFDNRSLSKFNSSNTKLKKSINFKGFVGINYEIAEKYLNIDFKLYFSLYLNKVLAEIKDETILLEIFDNNCNTNNKIASQIIDVNDMSYNDKYNNDTKTNQFKLKTEHSHSDNNYISNNHKENKENSNENVDRNNNRHSGDNSYINNYEKNNNDDNLNYIYDDLTCIDNKGIIKNQLSKNNNNEEYNEYAYLLSKDQSSIKDKLIHHSINNTNTNTYMNTKNNIQNLSQKSNSTLAFNNYSNSNTNIINMDDNYIESNIEISNIVKENSHSNITNIKSKFSDNTLKYLSSNISSNVNASQSEGNYSPINKKYFNNNNNYKNSNTYFIKPITLLDDEETPKYNDINHSMSVFNFSNGFISSDKYNKEKNDINYKDTSNIINEESNNLNKFSRNQSHSNFKLNNKKNQDKYSLEALHAQNAINHLIVSQTQLFTIEFIKSSPLLEKFISEYKQYFYKVFLAFTSNHHYMTYNTFLNFCLITDISPRLINRAELTALFTKFVISFEIIIVNGEHRLFEINYNSFFDLLLTISLRKNDVINKFREKAIIKIFNFLDHIIRSQPYLRFVINNKLLRENRKLSNLILLYRKNIEDQEYYKNTTINNISRNLNYTNSNNISVMKNKSGVDLNDFEKSSLFLPEKYSNYHNRKIENGFDEIKQLVYK